ncbi:MAG: zinc ribbon domain-containing protein [Candidatus Kariarchaeaceae archaeon]
MSVRTKALFIISFLLTVYFVAPTSSYTEWTTEYTSSGGSTYRYYTIKDNNTYNLNNGNFTITVGMEVIEFAAEVNDFHDIFLYLSLVNDDGLNYESFVSMGSITSTAVGIQAEWVIESSVFYWENDTDQLLPHWYFDIYVGAIFMEEKSLAADPMTDDRWKFIEEIFIDLGPNYQDNLTTSNPIDIQSTANPENSSFIDPVTTSIMPVPTSDPDRFPISTGIIFVLLIILGGFAYFTTRNPKRTFFPDTLSRRVKKQEKLQNDNFEPQETKFIAKSCPSCGTLNPDGSTFCMECGTHL